MCVFAHTHITAHTHEHARAHAGVATTGNCRQSAGATNSYVNPFAAALKLLLPVRPFDLCVCTYYVCVCARIYMVYIYIYACAHARVHTHTHI